MASSRKALPKPANDGSTLLGEAVWRRYIKRQADRIAAFDSKRIPQVTRDAKRRIRQGTTTDVSPVVENAHAALELAIKRKRAWSKPKQRSKGQPPWPTPRIWPPWWPGSKIRVLFFHTGNYSFATPNPQIYSQTPYSYLGGIGSTTIAEYADALTGSISLGFAGGDFRYSNGTIFSASPITEEFNFLVPCDGIAVAASVFQLADISNLPKSTGLTVSAGLQCPVRHSDPNNPDRSFSGLFELFPGLTSSALSGLVALEGYFNLTVTTLKNGQVVNSATATSILMQVQLINTAVPGAYGAGFKSLIEDCVFTAPETVDQTVYCGTGLTVGEADQLIVEAQVRLVGLRGGDDDPDAGYIAAAFQDEYHPVTPVDLGLLGYTCPFRVVSIGAFFD